MSVKSLFLSISAIVISALVPLAASGLAQELPDSDFQVWNETVVSIPVRKVKDAAGKESDKLTLLLLTNLRLGQKRLHPVDARVGAGFELKLNRLWSVSPTYVYRRGEPLRNRTEHEHRLRLDVSVGNKWKNFSLKDRNRLEFRIRHSRQNSVRYRNKLTLSIPITDKGKEMFVPFISDEIYYDFTAKEFSTNEISAGVSRRLSQNASADIFWARRDFRSGQIRHLNAIGINLKFRVH